MRRTCSVVFLMLILAMMAVCAVSVQAADRGRNVLLILDASGSMWGQLGGKTKIAIAKEVMSGIIQDLPSDLQTSLMIYGHRQKDDCNDVEVVIPFGPLDRNLYISTIHAIRPKGKTPITRSLSMAAEEIRKLGQGGSIILVSDGEETCEGDPCKLAAELKAGGLDVIMHVVGFGVKGVAAEQLACVAKAGGGTYAEAADAGKLKAALAGALEQTLAENLVIRTVQVSKAKGGKSSPLDARVAVFKDGAQIAESSGTRVGFKLDSGVYDVTVTIPSLDQSQTLQKIAVDAGVKTEKDVPFTVSAIGVRALDSLGKPMDVQVRIVRAGQDGVVAQGWSGVEQPRLFALPAGGYRLEITEQATRQQIVLEDVPLGDGEEVIKDVSFALARLGVRGKDSTGQAVNVHVKVFRRGEAGESVISDWSNAGDESFFELPPGVYDVVADEPDSKQSLEFKALSLDAGAAVVKEAVFALGRLGIRGKDSKGQRINVHVKVFRQGETMEPVIADWSNAGSDGYFELPPGIYDVVVEESGSGQSLEVKAVRLDAGATVDRDVSFATAKLGIRGLDSAGKAVNVHVEVFPQGETGKPVLSDWSNAGRDTLFELPPGTYDVAVEENKSQQTMELKAVSLEPGATVVKEVAFAVARLGIRGKDATGKAVNVHVKVFRTGEQGKPVASDWSNAGREHFFDLPPGTYDLLVEDAKLQQKTELPGITLEPGPAVVKEVVF